eukprot:GHVQ01016205.1.p1 GENE.GHVQ01016205.1~~GHVQ01016205.1.p1  ORF type:complete len:302 (+),score=39.06 GHVQ01016205.1:322-1227(+)
MKVVCECLGHTVDIAVGEGNQHIRWLGLAAALQCQELFHPNAFCIPHRILHDGVVLKPRQRIKDCVQKDGDVLTVELRARGFAGEDFDDEEAQWCEEAYGASSDLLEARFVWEVDHTNYTIPVKVRGEYIVDSKWQEMYPQDVYGGPFDIPLEPVEVNDQFEWIAVRKSVPGTCTYNFVLEDGKETICSSIPTIANGKYHKMTCDWDLQIGPGPSAVCIPQVEATSEEDIISDTYVESVLHSITATAYMDNQQCENVKDVLKAFFPMVEGPFVNYEGSDRKIGVDDVLHFLHLVTACVVVY